MFRVTNVWPQLGHVHKAGWFGGPAGEPAAR